MGNEQDMGQTCEVGLFELPRTVVKAVRECACARGEAPRPAGPLQYLWINVANGATTLDRDDWLNIVDEVATFGVRCMVVCVGGSLGANSHVWAITHWAQSVHDMVVGIHTECQSLSEAESEELARLDPDATWLFVPGEYLDAFRLPRSRGVKVSAVEACYCKDAPSCKVPHIMAFVDSKGSLYTCSQAVGNEKYRLGSVLEDDISVLVEDPSLLRAAVRGLVRAKHGCDVCPSHIGKRMVQSAP